MPSDVRIVLVRPSHGGNVGASARALKNMGLRELWLVQSHAVDEHEAMRLAHGAEDTLTAAHRCEQLTEALADCRWVLGTTRRAGKRRGAVYTPSTFAAKLQEQLERRPVAIVFGPEKDGLTAQELAHCQDIVRIPTAEAHPSLNLAQAVLIVAYELFTARGAGASARKQAARADLATARELEGLYAHLEEVLSEVGFVRPETAPHQMLALRKFFARAQPDPDEVTQWRGICHQVLWAVRHKPR